jgi:hypothetical protein
MYQNSLSLSSFGILILERVSERHPMRKRYGLWFFQNCSENGRLWNDGLTQVIRRAVE